MRITHLFSVRFHLPIVSTLLLLCAAGLRGVEPTPIPYEDPANWSTGVIDDQLLGNPGSPQYIGFTADRTMAQGLTIRQPSVDGKNFPMFFQGRNMDNSAGEVRRLTLNGPLIVDLGNSDATAIFAANVAFDFAGNPAVFELRPGESNLQIDGPITNASGLVRRGERSGRVLLHGATSDGVTGPLVVEMGWLCLVGEAVLPKITSVTLTGSPGGLAGLRLDHGGEFVPDRVSDLAPITSSGGGAIVLNGNAERSMTETLGRIALRDKGLLLEVKGGSATTPTTLRVAELLREPGTLLSVGGDQLGSAGRLMVTRDAPILATMKGGGGAAGSTNVSIVPWARGIGRGHIEDGYGFVTYARDTGFRELQPNKEYVQGLAQAKLNDNVRVASMEPALTQAKTINSLFLNQPQAIRRRAVDLGDKILTVTSGALSAEFETTVLGGELTSGGVQPLSFIGNYNLNVRLTGKGGAIFYGQTRLTNPANSLGGEYIVAGGQLTVTDDEIIPDGVTVRLHSDAGLAVEGSESLKAVAGNGRVRPAVAGRSSVMLGFCLAGANQVVVGIGGEILPGDISATPEIGVLRLWVPNGGDRAGSLRVEDGTLAFDVTANAHDQLILESENKEAIVVGGSLRVNLLNGFTPKVGASWDIISGTAPAGGRGFASIVDATGKGYTYSAAPIGNRWVLTVTSTP